MKFVHSTLMEVVMASTKKKEMVKSEPFSKLLSVKEVAEILGVSPVTIRSWDKSGKIRTIRTPGNQRRIPEEELRRILGNS